MFKKGLGASYGRHRCPLVCAEYLVRLYNQPTPVILFDLDGTGLNSALP